MMCVLSNAAWPGNESGDKLHGVEACKWQCVSRHDRDHVSFVMLDTRAPCPEATLCCCTR